jgi:hypothetical protein
MSDPVSSTVASRLHDSAQSFQLFAEAPRIGSYHARSFNNANDATVLAANRYDVGDEMKGDLD